MIYCFWALLKEDNDGEKCICCICYLFSFHMDRILMQYANIFQAVDKLLSLRFNWLVFLVLLLLPSYIWFLSLFISVAFRLKFHCSCWWCCCCILNLNHFSVGNSLHLTHTQTHSSNLRFLLIRATKKRLTVPVIAWCRCRLRRHSMCSVTSTALVVHWHR